MYVMQEYARDFGIPVKGGRVVIQGFGNVGSHLARLLDSEAGAKVIAVSSVEGGVYNDKGLDVPGLLAHVAHGKPVPEWSGGKRITNEERSEEHTSELQSQSNLVCRLLLEKKKKTLISYVHLNEIIDTEEIQTNQCYIV